MTHFKGFNDWIEIFRGGAQTDSQGRKHNGDGIIEKALSTFKATDHEPPLVVGHPTDNAPAFGWVEKLASYADNGAKVLMAKCKQVVPEFEDAVKKGLYKKRSASFYPDGRLRHVGFLGAAPPAVKALADLKFDEEDNAITFDFFDEGLSTIGRIFSRLRDYFIEKEGVDKANEIIPDWDVEYIREEAKQPTTQTGQEAVPAFSGGDPIVDDRGGAKTEKEAKNMSDFKEKFKNFLGFMGVDMSKVPDEALPAAAPEGAAPDSFTEADIEAAKEAAAKKAREEANAEFAEKEREKAKAAREQEITDWYDKGLDEGKTLPAWAKMGLKEFMLKLDAEEEISFAEESKGTMLEWFKDFMAEVRKVVEFKEVATRSENVQTGDAGEKLSAIVKQKRDKDPKLSFSEALEMAQMENPDLAKEYQQEIGRDA